MVFTSKGIYLLTVKKRRLVIKRWHFRFIFCFCYIVSIRGHKLQKEEKKQKELKSVNSIFPYPLLFLESNKIIGMGPLFTHWGFPRTVHRRDAVKALPAHQGSKINIDYYCQGSPQLNMTLGTSSCPSHTCIICAGPTGAEGSTQWHCPLTGMGTRWLPGNPAQKLGKQRAKPDTNFKSPRVIAPAR